MSSARSPSGTGSSAFLSSLSDANSLNGPKESTSAGCDLRRSFIHVVRARHPAETDDVGGQDRSDLAGFGHRAPHTMYNNTKADESRVAAMGRVPTVAYRSR